MIELPAMPIFQWIPSFNILMGLMWFFAEGLCLVYIRWAYLRLGLPEVSSNRSFAYLAILVFLSSVAIAIFIAHITNGPVGGRLTLYLNSTFWRFLCTGWVLIEGGVLFYVIELTGLFPAQKKGRLVKCLLFTTVLIFFAFYLSFEYYFWSFSFQERLKLLQLANLSRFFIKVSGFMWILIEWGVAIKGLQFLKYLRFEREAGR